MAGGRADPEELALLARTRGWQAAVHDYLRARDPVAYRYATDPQTATWRFLLSLPEEPRVLLVYPGLSVTPFLFAQDGAVVTCACRTATQADYILARASQQGFEQVRAYPWDGDRTVPEPEGELDLVASVGTADTPLLRDGPAVSQATVLREARRLLRPGGELFLAGPSRTHPRYLRRGLSLSACQRGLRAEGFADLRFYGLVPSHWQPFFIIPLWSGTSLQHSLDRLVRGYDFSEALHPAAWALWRGAAGFGLSAAQALHLTAVARLLMPAYGVVGRRGEAA